MMFTAEASLSESDVFSAGSIVVIEGQSLKLYPFGGKGPYFLEFRFLVDETGKMTFKNFNEGTGHIFQITNNNSALNAFATVIAPIYVANHAGRRVMLQFSIHLVGYTPPTRVINYTFLDGGPVV